MTSDVESPKKSPPLSKKYVFCSISLSFVKFSFIQFVWLRYLPFLTDVPKLPPLPGAEKKESPPAPEEEEPEEESEDADGKKARKKWRPSGPKVQDPYATDDTGSMMLPVFVAICAFIPLLFCLCRL